MSQQQEVEAYVLAQYERTQRDLFDLVLWKAQRQGWPTDLVEAAIETQCGKRMYRAWERWRA